MNLFIRTNSLIMSPTCYKFTKALAYICLTLSIIGVCTLGIAAFGYHLPECQNNTTTSTTTTTSGTTTASEGSTNEPYQSFERGVHFKCLPFGYGKDAYKIILIVIGSLTGLFLGLTIFLFIFIKKCYNYPIYVGTAEDYGDEERGYGGGVYRTTPSVYPSVPGGSSQSRYY